MKTNLFPTAAPISSQPVTVSSGASMCLSCSPTGASKRLAWLLLLMVSLVSQLKGATFPGNGKTYTIKAGTVFKPTFPEHWSTPTPEDVFRVTTPSSTANYKGPFHGWLYRKSKARTQSGWVVYDVWFEGTPTTPGVYPVVYYELDTDHNNDRYDGSFTVVVTDANGIATLSPLTTSLTATGGAGQFSMTASGSWSASASASWITLKSYSGSKNGTVSYTVAANTSTNARSGSITVGTLKHTVTQAGQALTTSISPASASASASGATGSRITVTSNTSWSAKASASWISISSGSSGSGNGTITYNVAAQSATSSRTGSISVGGHTHSITQAGLALTTSISPASVTAPNGGATGSVVTVTSNTTWTAKTSVTWIKITKGSSGSGNGSVTYSVSARTDNDTASRAGQITVGNAVLNLTQSGVTPVVALSPASTTLDANGASGSITVTSNTSWTASKTASWVSITSGTSGKGNGMVKYSVSAHTSTTARTTTISIGSSSFTIAQSGAGVTALSPMSSSMSASGGNGSFSVSASTSWSASKSASWITLKSSSGSKNGTVSYSVEANTSTASRTGTITVSKLTHTITQAGKTSATSISPTAATIPYKGAAGNRITDVQHQLVCQDFGILDQDHQRLVRLGQRHHHLHRPGTLGRRQIELHRPDNHWQLGLQHHAKRLFNDLFLCVCGRHGILSKHEGKNKRGLL